MWYNQESLHKLTCDDYYTNIIVKIEREKYNQKAIIQIMVLGDSWLLVVEININTCDDAPSPGNRRAMEEENRVQL